MFESGMKKLTQQKQVNVRLHDETLSRIDNCRMKLLKEMGQIPTRSDVVRMAIDEYLNKSCKAK